MNTEDEIKLLRLGFTMQRALEKALEEIREIILPELKKFEDRFNDRKKEEKERKNSWAIRESIDQWHKD